MIFPSYPDAIFVFGSNLAGHHGGGAAKFAMEQRGALWGIAEGLRGQSYAIPTCDAHIKPLPLDEISGFVDRFLGVARICHDLRFQVTPIGCGIAGFTPDQIGPMFAGAPGNCIMPVEFDGSGA